MATERLAVEAVAVEAQLAVVSPLCHASAYYQIASACYRIASACYPLALGFLQ